MEAKEFLTLYGKCCERIAFDRQRMKETENLVRTLNSRGAGSYKQGYQFMLDAEADALVQLKSSAERAVMCSSCSDMEKEVLYQRYILQKKWSDISKEMLYSFQHLNRIERSGLKKVRVPVEFRDRTVSDLLK